MPNVIYVNEEDGIKRVMNNTKLYVRLLTKFKDNTNLDDLTASANAQEWDKAKAAAHTLKGIAANLSLTDLYERSLDVETQIKGQSLNPKSLEDLKTCFSRTLAEVEKVIAKNA